MWFLLGALENDRFASCFLIMTFRNDEQKKCTGSLQMREMEITRRCCKRHSRGTKDLAFHQMTVTKGKKSCFF